jgi:HPt (histidine-containing phosphotransfer) domain-containing protein
MLREDVPARLAALRRLVGAGDAAGAQREAHGVKGAVANIGAAAMAAAALRLELAARDGAAGALPSALDELDREWAALAAALVQEGL